MDLKEIGISTRNWVDSAQDREYWRVILNVALNLRVPKDMELVVIIIVIILGLKWPVNGVGIFCYNKDLDCSEDIKGTCDEHNDPQTLPPPRSSIPELSSSLH